MKKEENIANPLPDWSWPFDVSQYDRGAALSPTESAALKEYARNYTAATHIKPPDFYTIVQRLIRPLEDVLIHTGLRITLREFTILFLLREMARRDRSFWGWSEEEWVETINSRWQEQQHIIAIAYLLCSFSRLEAVGGVHLVYIALARKIFGDQRIEAGVARVQETLTKWGHKPIYVKQYMQRTVCEAFLFNRSPDLEDLTANLLLSLKGKRTNRDPAKCLVALSRVLVSLGVLERPLPIEKPSREKLGYRSLTEGVSAEWARLTQYWFETSTLTRHMRRRNYYFLLNVGRWLAVKHPQVVSPEQWTRDLAAECVAMVCEMKCGEWTERKECCNQPVGKLLAPSTRSNRLSALRTFFRDLQEWGLIARRFDPHRCFTTPKTLRAMVHPNPRVIADDVWAKLLWAGLNLTVDDLPDIGQSTSGKKHPWYPIELIRALVVTWLFAGLRVNEILRLRVGCIRWQREDATIHGSDEALPKDAVCFLDVPVNKTGGAFSKPVDRAVGEAITAWEKVRPDQPRRVDPKTGELVDFLFQYRQMGIGNLYLNNRLIPLLCRKAGVATADVRGNITSHRARSTIASQLYNAKEPMSLFELQAWLGHSSPSATQHYAKITPTKLAKSYADAGYFSRNLRAVEVLIDQTAVANGAAMAGEPWRFYDLGHGYCTYDFFDQCPHRMACAKCAFYLPKASSRAQLLEAKENLLRLKQEIPLRDEECAAVEEGIDFMEKLCRQLADVPTPAGPTPRELGANGRRELPIVSAQSEPRAARPSSQSHKR
jgi:integrase